MPRDTYDPVVEGFAAGGMTKAEKPALSATLARLPDPSSIPPRKWLYGRILVEGYVSTVVAPGGVGKTAWSIAVGLSMASGKQRIGDWVYQRRAILVCTLEDPEDELDRRIAAAMIYHGIDRQEVAGMIHVVSGRDRQLLMATADSDRKTICHPDQEALTAVIRQHRIGVVIVDPFVNSHDLDENNNPHMNAAVRAWSELAHDAGCAVLLVHHTRKGAVAGDIESARGGVALTAASRVGLTLSAMSPEEAKQFKVADKDRRLHIRLDDGKANLAPPSDKARWFRLIGVDLHNGLDNTPWHHGDQVQTLEEWTPPSTVDQDIPTINRALDVIGAGLGNGQLYSSRRSGVGGGARWAGQVVMDEMDLDADQASRIIATWLRTGLLFTRDYHDPVARKMMQGVNVDSSKRPQ